MSSAACVMMGWVCSCAAMHALDASKFDRATLRKCFQREVGHRSRVSSDRIEAWPTQLLRPSLQGAIATTSSSRGAKEAAGVEAVGRSLVLRSSSARSSAFGSRIYREVDRSYVNQLSIIAQEAID